MFKNKYSVLGLFSFEGGGNGEETVELVRKALAEHRVMQTLTVLAITTFTSLETLTKLSDLEK